MKLIIYLQLKPIDRIDFTNDLLDLTRTECSDCLFFEADSHSEAYTIQQGIQFVKEASQTVMILDCTNGESAHGLAGLIEKVMRSKQNNALIIMKGENEMFLKMATLFRKQIIQFESTVQCISQIKKYISSNSES
jgi:hypothetical protein